VASSPTSRAIYGMGCYGMGCYGMGCYGGTDVRIALGS